MPAEPADEYSGGRNASNQRHGVGIWTHSDGRRYSGGWKDGKRHGEGTMEYADGASYAGGFSDGRSECNYDDRGMFSCKLTQPAPSAYPAWQGTPDTWSAH